MGALVLISSIYISWRDHKDHLIKNRSLFILALFLSIQGELHLAEASIGAVSLLAVAAFTGLGGGDVKLILILILFRWPLLSSYIYILLLAFLTPVCLLVSRRKGFVALAPAILLPLAILNLGI